MDRVTPQVEPPFVGTLVARVGFAPIRAAGLAADGIKAIALGIFLEIMMIPEESWPRRHAGHQTPMLEYVYIRKSIRVQLSQGDPRLLQEFLQQGEHRKPKAALEGVLGDAHAPMAVLRLGSLVDAVVRDGRVNVP